LKGIHKLPINTKETQEQDWEVLPYHEMNKEKGSCNETVVERTKANESQLGYNTYLNIPIKKLEGMLDYQILNMKMEVKLGLLINIGKVLLEDGR
jgi:hypothetical protein